MKKLILSVIAGVALTFGAQAVPRGIYYEVSNYKDPVQKVLVSDSGDIHILDNNGYVKQILEVVEEHNEGDYVAFTTRDKSNGITYYGNAYQRQNDGSVQLDLKQLRKIVTRR